VDFDRVDQAAVLYREAGHVLLALAEEMERVPPPSRAVQGVFPEAEAGE
jgi:hypothetical protein